MTANRIQTGVSDPALNALLARSPEGERPLSRHFSQTEEFFVRTQDEYGVPRLAIHHDVRRPEPDPGYLARLGEVLSQLLQLVPQLWRGLTYLFDPAEVLRPSFFQLHRLGERRYLYLLRLDLAYRPQSHRVLERGDNDLSPAYSTREMYLESFLIPLQGVETENGRVDGLLIDQAISNTWVGETGRGYFVQGIWMDNDLTRFFSRLLLPAGQRTYPYFPYLCRYRTLCRSLVRFSAEEREAALPQLDRAYGFLKPVMGRVESALKGQEFSEDNPVFRELKSRIPESWYLPWEGLRVEAYLNEYDHKEYRIEDRAP
ncbi:MAG: hypothetical protein A2064_13065 [Spirochaetes bacterium GWB1_66_5]|nr:MAG: hypothetical protein A2064_13065 [Spirochaetes bacterium GWB1_66_5]